jgi:hypothetical protein
LQHLARGLVHTTSRFPFLPVLSDQQGRLLEHFHLLHWSDHPWGRSFLGRGSGRVTVATILVSYHNFVALFLQENFPYNKKRGTGRQQCRMKTWRHGKEWPRTCRPPEARTGWRMLFRIEHNDMISKEIFCSCHRSIRPLYL